jgi:hypothetical protein
MDPSQTENRTVSRWHWWHVLKYLKGTRNHGLCYFGSTDQFP